MHPVSADGIARTGCRLPASTQRFEPRWDDKLGRTQVHWRNPVWFTKAVIPNVLFPKQTLLFRGRHHADWCEKTSWIYYYLQRLLVEGISLQHINLPLLHAIADICIERPLILNADPEQKPPSVLMNWLKSLLNSIGNTLYLWCC